MPSKTRTHNLRIRSPTLYPIELQAQIKYNRLMPNGHLSLAKKKIPFFNRGRRKYKIYDDVTNVWMYS